MIDWSADESDVSSPRCAKVCDCFCDPLSVERRHHISDGGSACVSDDDQRSGPDDCSDVIETERHRSNDDSIGVTCDGIFEELLFCFSFPVCVADKGGVPLCSESVDCRTCKSRVVGVRDVNDKQRNGVGSLQTKTPGDEVGPVTQTVHRFLDSLSSRIRHGTVSAQCVRDCGSAHTSVSGNIGDVDGFTQVFTLTNRFGCPFKAKAKPGIDFCQEGDKTPPMCTCLMLPRPCHLSGSIHPSTTGGVRSRGCTPARTRLLSGCPEASGNRRRVRGQIFFRRQGMDDRRNLPQCCLVVPHHLL